VPQHTIDIDAECVALAAETLHAFHQVRCSWPPPSVAGEKLVALTGDLPNIHDLNTAAFEIGTPGLPASTLLSWLRVASARFPADETATGVLTAKFSRDPLEPSGSNSRQAAWAGDLLLHGGTLSAVNSSEKAPVPFIIDDLSITSDAPSSSQSFLLSPTTLNLGGKEPAVLEGHFDANGYTLHLTGMASPARLLALGAALPQFGDGFAELFPTASTTPVRIDLTANRSWTLAGVRQPWVRTAPVAPAASGRHRRRR